MISAVTMCRTGMKYFGSKMGAYGKAGNGNETETGNGNWKQKWEQKTHQSLVQHFLHSVSCSLVPRPTFSLIACSV